MGRPEIENLFPTLCESPFEITSPATRAYNCTAWVAHDVRRWWWPAPGGYWPDDASKERSLGAFRRMYELLGFQYCPSRGYEEGFEKVAVFVDVEGKPTHAARQLRNGRWTSKLGGAEDIEHELHDLEGDQYGRVGLVMKRPWEARS